MDIDWTALVKVAVVSFAFAVGIVTVYSLGILGPVRAAGPGDGEVAGEGERPGSGAGQVAANRARVGTAPPDRRSGLTVMVVCFAACAAAVLYGLWLIIPQFH